MIRFNQVHKTLGGKVVLDGLDLHVAKGETMVIVGASGTGKSVTLKHMVGLLRPDAGTVHVGDQEVSSCRGAALEQVRERFGVLFQSGALINWMSVGENVALPLIEKTRLRDEEIARRVSEKLAMVDLDGHEAKYPSEISGGMKKRVGLARAIVRDPEILLYDEPTSGLDPVMARQVDHLIRELQAKLGVTSVVVTHDLASAFTVGDRITMLHLGRAAAVAKPADFMNSNNPQVRAFVDAQFEAEKRVRSMTGKGVGR